MKCYLCQHPQHEGCCRADAYCVCTTYSPQQGLDEQLTGGSVKVLNEYQYHHYMDEYQKCDLFCPNCGVRSVWQEQSPGDYYFGENFICTACTHDFTIQGPAPMSQQNQLKKIDQLRSGKTLEPTTPKGN